MYNFIHLFHTINGDFMKHIMSSPVIVGNINDTIENIAVLMKKYNIGFLPIAKANKIVGVITDRDLVIGAFIQLKNGNTPVENYITHHVVSIKSSGKVEEVLQLMTQYKVKRILVTEKNKVIGVIAFSDLLHNVDSQQLIDTLKKIDENKINFTQDYLEIDSFYL